MTKLVAALTCVNENCPEDLATYLATTTPLLQKAGAKILFRVGVDKTIVGQSSAKYLTLVEYPDEEAIRMVFESSEYGLLKEVRERAFSHYEIFLLEDSDGPLLALISS